MTLRCAECGCEFHSWEEIYSLEYDEYGGLELTVEAELFYTPGRSYFTPPDGHILQ